MAGDPGDAGRTEQLNIRLPKPQFDVLQAIAFVEEKSKATVAREILEKVLEEKSQDPDVKMGLTVLASVRARRSGKLKELRRDDGAGA